MTISVLFLTTYPIKVPIHGGQLRAHALCDTYIANGAKVRNIAVYTPENWSKGVLDEYDIPLPPNARKYQNKNIPFISDYLSGVYAVSHSGYELIKARLPSQVDIIHVEQPWLFKLALHLKQEKSCLNAKLVYGSQNLEAPLKKDIFLKNNIKNTDEIIKEIVSLENVAELEADFILAVSRAEGAAIAQNTKKKIIYAPNGISAWSASNEKINHWTKKLPKEPWALFVGSEHSPNLQGYIDCLGDSLACISPESKIIVVGGVGQLIKAHYNKHPCKSMVLSRLKFYPNLANDDFAAVKKLASVFILPITYGGGSNIKTAEAIYSGKSIIGTPCSFRGYEDYLALPGIHIVEGLHAFRQKIKSLLLYEEKIVDTTEQASKRQNVLWENCLTNPIQTILENAN
jgi:hypothetical protein